MRQIEQFEYSERPENHPGVFLCLLLRNNRAFGLLRSQPEPIGPPLKCNSSASGPGQEVTLVLFFSHVAQKITGFAGFGRDF
jgi:hypothetical protein